MALRKKLKLTNKRNTNIVALWWKAHKKPSERCIAKRKQKKNYELWQWFYTWCSFLCFRWCAHTTPKCTALWLNQSLLLLFTDATHCTKWIRNNRKMLILYSVFVLTSSTTSLSGFPAFCRRVSVMGDVEFAFSISPTLLLRVLPEPEFDRSLPNWPTGLTRYCL